MKVTLEEEVIVIDIMDDFEEMDEVGQGKI